MSQPATAVNHNRTIANDEVLAAARELLRTVSVVDFSVRELAKAMGLVPGTIYARFGTKDELLGQLYLGRMDDFLAHLDQLQPSKVASMAALVDAVGSQVGKLRHEFELHFMRDTEPAPAVQEATWEEMQSRFRSLSKALYGRIREAAANEGVTLVKGSLAQRYVWTVLASVPITQSAVAHGHRNQSYARFVAAALLASLRADEGADGRSATR